jgi:hypothetical protein
MNQKVARLNLLSMSQIAIALFLNCISPFLNGCREKRFIVKSVPHRKNTIQKRYLKALLRFGSSKNHLKQAVRQNL